MEKPAETIFEFFGGDLREEFVDEILDAVQWEAQLKFHAEEGEMPEWTNTLVAWLVGLVPCFISGDVVEYWNTDWPWYELPEEWKGIMWGALFFAANYTTKGIFHNLPPEKVPLDALCHALFRAWLRKQGRDPETYYEGHPNIYNGFQKTLTVPRQEK